MLHRLFLHIVWTTLERRPLLDTERAGCLERLLPQVAGQEAARLIGVGVVSTHIHILLRVHPLFEVSRFVRRAKSVTALICRRDELGDPARPLRWAKGYSVTSVSPGSVSQVLRYLDDQPKHHPQEAIVR
jgi:REP element-mobilizing transposase RayT